MSVEKFYRPKGEVVKLAYALQQYFKPDNTYYALY